MGAPTQTKTIGGEAMITRDDFLQWLGTHGQEVETSDGIDIAVHFANDAMAVLTQLIADIITHVDTQADNRYASVKDAQEVADQLNRRILVALEGADYVYNHPDNPVPDPPASQGCSSTAEPRGG